MRSKGRLGIQHNVLRLNYNQRTIAVQNLGCQFNFCGMHALTRAKNPE